MLKLKRIRKKKSKLFKFCILEWYNLGAFANPPDPNTNDTLLWHLLEPILPYFPGGDGLCQFDRVFIGTFALAQNQGPDGEWVLELLVYPDFRANYLARQKAVAQEFADKVQQSAYPNVKWEWYVTPEMCLDYVNFDYYGSATDPKYTESWTEYVSKHIADLNSIRSGRHFFWSPSRYFAQKIFLFAQNFLIWKCFILCFISKEFLFEQKS